MKLQKILLAAMAVVIAAATVAFYETPSPILYDASRLEPDNIWIEWMRPTGENTEPEGVEVSEQVDREAVREILSRYTRSRAKMSGKRFYMISPGEIDLTMHLEGDGPSHIVLGADDGASNFVYSSFDEGIYEIYDAPDLYAELAALLPR